MTKAAWGLKYSNYWDRLKSFKLYSNERRMERYLCIYIWKSLNGHVPSLGLKWSKVNNRNGPSLIPSTLSGPDGIAKTAMRKSIRHQGVIIYSSLPEYIMRHEGSPESFKSVLDEYLTTIPDQPEVGGLIPGARTLTGKSSNSILDWPRSMGRTIY